VPLPYVLGPNFEYQGSVATRLKCGGMFNDRFIANFLENVKMNEFLKSTNIW